MTKTYEKAVCGHPVEYQRRSDRGPDSGAPYRCLGGRCGLTVAKKEEG